MNFQENLRAYREKLGINAKDFAAMVGVKYSTYASYENLGREPKYDTLGRIAAALHVSIDDLLGYQLNKFEYWRERLKGMGVTVKKRDDKIEVIGNQGEVAAFIDENEFIAAMVDIENEANAFIKPSQEFITKTMVEQFIDRKKFSYQVKKIKKAELLKRYEDKGTSELEKAQILLQIKSLENQ